MPTLIAQPTRIQAAGNSPGSSTISEFDEFAVVLKRMFWLEHKNGSVEVRAEQALMAYTGEWVRYWTPDAGGPDTCT
jgi:hypothetical protein